MKILEKVKALDQTMQAWVVKNQNPMATQFFKLFTVLGTSYVWICVYGISFILGSGRIRFIVFSIIIAELFGLLLIIILRNLCPRDRPRRGIKYLKPFVWNYQSFPSQHALRCGILAIIGGIYFPAAILAISGVALLILFSRIYLQWHYFSDVVVGFLAGILCVFFVLLI